MADYLTTHEVAAYLHLNEKKIYALVARGQLPAARISGKWLFPKHLIDQWVEQNTIYPSRGLMGAMLDEMLIHQGSDDWLIAQVEDRYRVVSEVPVVSARVGSLSGLRALGSGAAHLATYHVGNEHVRELAAGEQGCYMIHLFTRQMGLMFDRLRNPGIDGLQSVADQGLTLALRQPGSGTHRLVNDLLSEQGLEPDGIAGVGAHTSHLEVALAVRSGGTDAGVGIRIAAELCGLDFLPLRSEPFKLAVPVEFASHPQVSRFLDFLLEDLRRADAAGAAGYGFLDLGKMETTGQGKRAKDPT